LRGRAIPVLHDDSIREAVEHHRPELDSLAGWGDALELPITRPLMPHVIRAPVVFCDKCLDHRLEVWARHPPCSNLHLRVFRQLATRLVDDIEDAAVERLVHVSPNVRFVRLAVPREIAEPIGGGSPVIVLEAMKLEHELIAETDATFERLDVKVGDAVSGGQLLASARTPDGQPATHSFKA
jgi:hypothetical protein